MLPRFQLCYAMDRHRKVAPDAFVVAPRGDRSLLFFCSHEGEDACYLFRLNRHGKPDRGRRVLACFSSDLCAGTLLYGVSQSDGTRFICEDVLWMRGEQVDRLSLIRKIPVWQDLFSRGIGPAPSVRYLDICLPVWTEDRGEAEKQAATSVYPCRGVFGYGSRLPGLRPLLLSAHTCSSRHRASLPGPSSAQGPAKAILIAEAFEAADTYDLYGQAPEGLQRIGRACIPSLKASVMMNGFLRKIKENQNLDLLEESDDDTEFEDVAADRYLHPGRRVMVLCRYNPRHCAWEPLEAAPVGSSVTPVADLLAQPGFSNRNTHAKDARTMRRSQKGRGRLRSPSTR